MIPPIEHHLRVGTIVLPLPSEAVVPHPPNLLHWQEWKKNNKPAAPSTLNRSPTIREALQYLVDCHVARATFLTLPPLPAPPPQVEPEPVDNDLMLDVGGPNNSDDEDTDPADAHLFEIERGPRLLIRFYVLPQDVEGRRHIPPLAETKQVRCRNYMHFLLSRVDKRPEMWNYALGVENDLPRAPRGGLYAYKTVHKRLADIYAEMPSPAPFVVTDGRADAESRRLLNECLTMSGPRSMTTTLFNYQKKSVWKMLQRETFPQNVLATDFLECRSADGGRLYWLEMITGKLYNDPQYWADGTGGVICEDMGTGKTCICIALILHTRHQISSAPVDCCVQVDLNQTYLDSEPTDPTIIEIPPPCPTLKALAASATMRSRIPYRHLKHTGLQPHIYKLLRNSPAYYMKRPVEGSRSSRRYSEDNPGVKIYLSSCTLVVVPDTLVNQWRAELNKHTEAGSVKVMVITDTNASIPPAVELLKYDIVLISYPRFGLEQRRGGLDSRTCSCPESSRYCSCSSTNTYRSPLLDLRWLRLIVDEGHAMAKKVESGSAVLLASRLDVERRWVCTGTPMPNVLVREVVEEEGRDLEKFGMLLVEFLGVEPWRSSPNEFKNVVAKPFLEKGFRGYEKLKGLMERVMVRNRQEDIERDIQLPPLHEKVVPLHFTPIQRLLHNSLLSQIATNAVLSQREDQDYFFHPSNRKFLRQVVSHLHQSCFWYTGGDEFLDSLRSTAENVVEALDWVEKGKVEYGEEDVEILKRVRRICRGAARSRVLRWVVGEGVVGAEEVGEVAFVVHGGGERAVEGWRDERGEVRGLWLGGGDGMVGLVSGKSVEGLRRRVGEREKREKEEMEKVERERVEKAEAERKAVEEAEMVEDAEMAVNADGAEAGQGSTSGQNDTVMREAISAVLAFKGETMDTPAASTKDVSTSTPSAGSPRPDNLHEADGPSTLIESESSRPARPHGILKRKRSTLPTREELFSAQIISTTSSKLTYLADQILLYAPTQKIIVYCQWDNEIYYITALLRLLNIPHRSFHRRQPVWERAQVITTFNTNEKLRVLVMFAGIASWGIDLSSASRVYFVSPIWESSMERQAVKRAHRMGCTKPVYVETLVIKGSFEEEMVKRRTELGKTNHKRIMSITDDGKMRQILSAANFVKRLSSRSSTGGDTLPSSASDLPTTADATHSQAAVESPSRSRDKGKGKPLEKETDEDMEMINTMRKLISPIPIISPDFDRAFGGTAEYGGDIDDSDPDDMIDLSHATQPSLLDAMSPASEGMQADG
ncbi:hypothetical protein HK097_008312, partial [Rhizophlyctis rosea]